MIKGSLDLESDTFEQLKPGLSQWADQPDKAAESLQPLLDTALKTVPKELQVCPVTCIACGCADVSCVSPLSWVWFNPMCSSVAQVAKASQGVNLCSITVVLQASTPLKVGATAGLRLLPGDKSVKILDAVTQYLKKQPFKLTDVTIIDGA